MKLKPGAATPSLLQRWSKQLMSGHHMRVEIAAKIKWEKEKEKREKEQWEKEKRWKEKNEKSNSGGGGWTTMDVLKPAPLSHLTTHLMSGHHSRNQ